VEQQTKSEKKMKVTIFFFTATLSILAKAELALEKVKRSKLEWR